MKKALTLVILLFGFNCIAQTYPQSDFSPYTVDKAFSNSWLRLDTARNSFSVAIVAGKLQISKAINSDAKELPAGDGTLLALDLGEWGGGLYYKPNDISKKTFSVNGDHATIDDKLNGYKMFLSANDPVRKNIDHQVIFISPGNISNIIKYNQGWLFMSGWRNLGKNQGELSMLTMQQDSFVFSKLFDFDAVPVGITNYNNKLYITAYNSFYIINGEKKELVLDDIFWNSINPNSIAVIDDENIFVGLRGGYAKIDAIKKDIKVYIYNK